MQGNEHLSSVALVLSCSATASATTTTIEAWCIALSIETSINCICGDVLGAALYCTPAMLSSGAAFNPLVVVATDIRETSGIVIELYELLNNDPWDRKETNVRAILNLSQKDEVYEIPTMAMGSSPPVLCLCWDKFIVIIVRDWGLLACYELLENTMTLVLKHDFGRYVVDAGIQTRKTDDGIDIVALVCESNTKDGRIVTLSLK